VVGSDLGGYLDRDDVELTMEVPADAQTFMRWTGLSAMTPFMQLHGRANLEPWSKARSSRWRSPTTSRGSAPPLR
jgi:alpha-glucosidase (family GH31 glycosyl hydrolase)